MLLDASIEIPVGWLIFAEIAEILSPELSLDPVPAKVYIKPECVEQYLPRDELYSDPDRYRLGQGGSDHEQYPLAGCQLQSLEHGAGRLLPGLPA